jgi:hypothetical protein
MVSQKFLDGSLEYEVACLSCFGGGGAGESLTDASRKWNNRHNSSGIGCAFERAIGLNILVGLLPKIPAKILQDELSSRKDALA